MSSSSNPSSAVPAAGSFTRLLNNVLQGNGQDLRWREEPVEVSHDKAKSTYWNVTAIVDGDPMDCGSGPKLRVAKDQAAKKTLILLGTIEP
ncbi:hypothetical protein BS47DRAFT_1351327 [Hydnum rufescens UP504]|uniref:DRBM domain-containing protein n=1 Tax=Hydnum rufescens UP504 TaxID=1448309 RepID=A0A9P6ALW3_9AGAM|nr:hypothetical protein BS47DRAFT_1351327 [Hydnum rufescens UP504]